jgi:RNA polymerase sigma factor (sigma-70 family)
MMSEGVSETVENLFRKESGKLASSLSRAFGLSNLGTVEDIVQDTLLAALESWSFRGLPENPTAWLHRVAKNKAIDRIRKRNLERTHQEESIPGLSAASHSFELEQHFLTWEISDSELRMMFACCHPGISAESRIALVLKTLCGFSVREIANAFLTQVSTIEKRLTRARAYFRDQHVAFEVPSREAVQERTGTVLRCLYLLFNEGYKQTERSGVVNPELCVEALRLAILLADHPDAGSEEALALVSLMTFHVARFNARTNDAGDIVLLSEQNRTLWDRRLIETAMNYFRRSHPDELTSTYHLEAAIQSLHANASSYAETDWAAILGLYKRLFAMTPSKIVAMHMAVPMCKVHGPQAAIELLNRYPVPDYYLFHAILGDCLEQSGDMVGAQTAFAEAVRLSRNDREKALLGQRLAAVSTS